MTPSDRPIGVFDSGIGGLTVVRSLDELLPQENLIYFGDTARFPYGPRPVEQVREFALQTMDFMSSMDVKMMVIACNSMTAAAYDEALDLYEIPVIGVIEPAVRAAVRATHNGKVGVIGTKATIESGAYDRVLGRTDERIKVTSQICPKFVEHVESGDTFSEKLFEVAEGYLDPLIQVGVDTLILGCTHYPLLRGVLHSVTKGAVELVSSAEEVAKDVYSTLHDLRLLRQTKEIGFRRFLVSGDPDQFLKVGSRFLPGLSAVEHRGWESI